ncbi:MAG: DUF2273 domain-containing protein [Bacillota bacterium]
MLTRLIEVLDGHWGKVGGVVLGLLFGWFAISYGLWRALFVASMAVLGYFIGKQVDERTDWDKLLHRFRGGR